MMISESRLKRYAEERHIHAAKDVARNHSLDDLKRASLSKGCSNLFINIVLRAIKIKEDE